MTPEEFAEAIERAWAVADVETLDRLSEEAAELQGAEWRYWHLRAAMVSAFCKEDHSLTVELGQQCIDATREAGLREEEAAVIGTTALVHTITGNYVQALDLFHRSLHLNRELDNVRGIGLDTSNIGLTYSYLGEQEKALEYFEKAIAIFRQHELVQYIARTSAFIAEAYRQLGRFDEALDVIEEGKKIFKDRESPTGVAYNSMIQARVLLEAGRLDECKEILDHLEANPTNYPDAIFETNLVRAKFHARINNRDEAERQYIDLLKKAKESLRQAKVVEIYGALREIAEKKSDLKGYIRYNNAYLAAVEELTGKETTQRIAIQESDRRVEQERIERERERSVLFSTMPRDVAERIIRGESVTDHYDIATVLFMDIVDFTSKSEGMPATVLVSVLEGVFEECDEICTRFELLKIKTIGDAYMAVAFNDQSSDPCLVRSVITAFHFVDIKRTWPDGSPIQMRVGLNTGPVVAGIIGRTRIQYDIWGDTVNTASRMESTGKAGKVQVNYDFVKNLNPELPVNEPEGTTHDIGPGWRIESRGPQNVKGKGAMTTYWLSKL